MFININRNRYSVLSKAIAMVLVCLFFVNDVSWALDSSVIARPSRSSSLRGAEGDEAISKLAAQSAMADTEFMEKVMCSQFILSVDALMRHLNLQLEREKGIFKGAWKKNRVQIVEDIYDDKARGRIKGRVDGLKSIVFVKSAGFMAATGQMGWVDVNCELETSKEFGGIPVVYIDSTLCDTLDRCVQKHEIDEILQWEHFRVNVLGFKDNESMAAWIVAHIDSPDEKLNNTEYKDMNSRQVAQLFCGYSYPLRGLYEKMKGSKDFGYRKEVFDFNYIWHLVQLMRQRKQPGTDEESSRVNIAAKGAGLPPDAGVPGDASEGRATPKGSSPEYTTSFWLNRGFGPEQNHTIQLALQNIQLLTGFEHSEIQKFADRWIQFDDAKPFDLIHGLLGKKPYSQSGLFYSAYFYGDYDLKSTVYLRHVINYVEMLSIAATVISIFHFLSGNLAAAAVSFVLIATANVYAYWISRFWRTKTKLKPLPVTEFNVYRIARETSFIDNDIYLKLMQRIADRDGSPDKPRPVPQTSPDLSPKPPAAPRPSASHEAAREAEYARLLNNPWIKLICARRDGDGAYLGIYMNRDHPMKIEEFSKIDALPDDAILKRADEFLAGGDLALKLDPKWTRARSISSDGERNLTLKQLFLHIGAGSRDLTQLLLSYPTQYGDPKAIDRALKNGGENEEHYRTVIASRYLIIKAIEILSRKQDTVLISSEDIAESTEYSLHVKARGDHARQLLSFSDLAIPADTPQKIETLKNLIRIIETLQRRDDQWRKELDTVDNRVKIDQICDVIRTFEMSQAAPKPPATGSTTEPATGEAGCIYSRSGSANAIKEMVKNVRKGNVRDARNEEINAAISRIEERVKKAKVPLHYRLVLDMALSDLKKLPLLRTRGIVLSSRDIQGIDDYALGFYSRAPPVRDTLKDLPESLILAAQVLDAVEDTELEEYLLHEALCHLCPAHDAAKAITRMLYQDDNYKDHLFHNGALGFELRNIITYEAEARISDDPQARIKNIINEIRKTGEFGDNMYRLIYRLYAQVTTGYDKEHSVQDRDDLMFLFKLGARPEWDIKYKDIRLYHYFLRSSIPQTLTYFDGVDTVSPGSLVQALNNFFSEDEHKLRNFWISKIYTVIPASTDYNTYNDPALQGFIFSGNDFVIALDALSDEVKRFDYDHLTIESLGGAILRSLKEDHDLKLSDDNIAEIRKICAKNRLIRALIAILREDILDHKPLDLEADDILMLCAQFQDPPDEARQIESTRAFIMLNALKKYPYLGAGIMKAAEREIGALEFSNLWLKISVRIKAIGKHLKQLKKEHRDVYSLFAKRENLLKLARAASIMREYFPYELNSDDILLSPLDYAIKHGIYLHLTQDIYMTPITGSFKRHILFKMDSNRHVTFMAEMKIPGKIDRRRFTALGDIETYTDMRNNFGEEAPMVDVIGTFEPRWTNKINMYGAERAVTKQEPLSIILFNVSQPGRRLRDVSAADRKRLTEYYIRYTGDPDLVAMDYGRDVLRLVAMLHALGYKGVQDDGGSDIHSHNWRLALPKRRDGCIRAYAVVDFSSFHKMPDPNKAAKYIQRDIEEILCSVFPGFPGLIGLYGQCSSEKRRQIYDSYLKIYEEEYKKAEETLRGKAISLDLHELHYFLTQGAATLSRFDENPPQFQGFADIYPVVADRKQVISAKEPICVTVDFDKPVRYLRLLKIAMRYGDPAKTDRWQNAEGVLINDYEKSYRFGIGLPKGAKEYTLRISSDGGRTWTWLGWNIVPQPPAIRAAQEEPSPDSPKKPETGNTLEYKINETIEHITAGLRIANCNSDDIIPARGYRLPKDMFAPISAALLFLAEFHAYVKHEPESSMFLTSQLPGYLNTIDQHIAAIQPIRRRIRESDELVNEYKGRLVADDGPVATAIGALLALRRFLETGDDENSSALKKTKGSCADCLNSIIDNDVLLEKALSRDGFDVETDLKPIRRKLTNPDQPFSDTTIYDREIKPLIALGILIRLEDGKIKFSDMMMRPNTTGPPDKAYTINLIHQITEIKYPIGKQGDAKDKPFHRGEIPSEMWPDIKDLVMDVVRRYQETHPTAAGPAAQQNPGVSPGMMGPEAASGTVFQQLLINASIAADYESARIEWKIQKGTDNHPTVHYLPGNFRNHIQPDIFGNYPDYFFSFRNTRNGRLIRMGIDDVQTHFSENAAETRAAYDERKRLANVKRRRLDTINEFSAALSVPEKAALSMLNAKGRENIGDAEFPEVDRLCGILEPIIATHNKLTEIMRVIGADRASVARHINNTAYMELLDSLSMEKDAASLKALVDHTTDIAQIYDNLDIKNILVQMRRHWARGNVASAIKDEDRFFKIYLAYMANLYVANLYAPDYRTRAVRAIDIGSGRSHLYEALRAIGVMGNDNLMIDVENDMPSFKDGTNPNRVLVETAARLVPVKDQSPAAADLERELTRHGSFDHIVANFSLSQFSEDELKNLFIEAHQLLKIGNLDDPNDMRGEFIITLPRSIKPSRILRQAVQEMGFVIMHDSLENCALPAEKIKELKRKYPKETVERIQSLVERGFYVFRLRKVEERPTPALESIATNRFKLDKTKPVLTKTKDAELKEKGLDGVLLAALNEIRSLRPQDVQTRSGRFLSRQDLLAKVPRLEERLFILETALPLLPLSERHHAEGLVAVWNDITRDRISDDFVSRVDQFFEKTTDDPIGINFLIPVKTLRKKMRQLEAWIDEECRDRNKLPPSLRAKIISIRKRWDANSGNILWGDVVAIRHYTRHERIKQDAMYLLKPAHDKWGDASREVKRCLARDLIMRTPGKDRLSQLSVADFRNRDVLGTSYRLIGMLNSLYGTRIQDMLSDIGEVVVKKSREQIEREAPEVLSSGSILWKNVSLDMKKYLVEWLIRATAGKDRLSQLTTSDFQNTYLCGTDKTLFGMLESGHKRLQDILEELGEVVVEKTQAEVEEEAAILLRDNVDWQISVPMKRYLIESLIRAVPGKDCLSQLADLDFHDFCVLGTDKSLIGMWSFYKKDLQKMLVELGEVVVIKSSQEIKKEALLLLQSKSIYWGKISIPMKRYLIESLISAVPGKDRLSQLVGEDFTNFAVAGTDKTLSGLLGYYRQNPQNALTELGEVIVTKPPQEIEKEALLLLQLKHILWNHLSISMKRHLIESLIRAVPGKDRLSQLVRQEFANITILGTDKTLVGMWLCYKKKSGNVIQSIQDETGDVIVVKQPPAVGADTSKKPKGSCADCLNSIIDNGALLEKALSKEGFDIETDLKPIRRKLTNPDQPFSDTTIYDREIKPLIALDILIRLPDGKIKFSDMMMRPNTTGPPDKQYTIDLIRQITEIVYPIGKQGPARDKPFHRDEIPTEILPAIKELVMNVVRRYQEAQPLAYTGPSAETIAPQSRGGALRSDASSQADAAITELDSENVRERMTEDEIYFELVSLSREPIQDRPTPAEAAEYIRAFSILPNPSDDVLRRCREKIEGRLKDAEERAYGTSIVDNLLEKCRESKIKDDRNEIAFLIKTKGPIRQHTADSILEHARLLKDGVFTGRPLKAEMVIFADKYGYQPANIQTALLAGTDPELIIYLIGKKDRASLKENALRLARYAYKKIASEMKTSDAGQGAGTAPASASIADSAALQPPANGLPDDASVADPAAQQDSRVFPIRMAPGTQRDECIIKTAAPEDAAAIARLWRNSFVPNHRGIINTTEADYEKSIRNIIELSNTEPKRVFIALLEGKIVGYLTAAYYKSKNGGYIGDTAVAGEFQRSGIGTKLVCHAINWLKETPDLGFIRMKDESRNLATTGIALKMGFEDKGHYNLLLEVEKPATPASTALPEKSGYKISADSDVGSELSDYYLAIEDQIYQKRILPGIEIILQGCRTSDSGSSAIVTMYGGKEYDEIKKGLIILNGKVVVEHGKVLDQAEVLGLLRNGDVVTFFKEEEIESILEDWLRNIAAASGEIYFTPNQADILRVLNERIRLPEPLKKIAEKLSIPGSFEVCPTGQIRVVLDTSSAPQGEKEIASSRLAAQSDRGGIRNDGNETRRNDGGEELTARNVPDIENLRQMLYKIAEEERKNEQIAAKGGQAEYKYYTIGYDITKIPHNSPAEELLKYYCEKVLGPWLNGDHRVKLLPPNTQEEGVIWVECYKGRPENGQKIGEGRVYIDEYKDNEAMRLIGMLNMAFLASQIPADLSPDRRSEYEPMILMIEKQFGDISGEPPTSDTLKFTPQGIYIKLPHAAQIPLDKTVDEYYRLTITQLEQAA